MVFDLSRLSIFDKDMNTKPVHEHVEEDDYDDEFFAEMRKQVMILTGDHNADFFPETEAVEPSSYSSVTDKGTGVFTFSSSKTSSGGNRFSLWHNEYTTKSVEIPVQNANSGKSSTGTGVFIPQNTVITPKYIPKRLSKSGGKVNNKNLGKQVKNKHRS